jgi:outer membrane lipoprotein SlyB
VKYFLSMLLVGCLAISLTGCNNDISANDYSSADAGVVGKVVPGIILSKRLVHVKTSTGVGNVAGGVAGGILGTAIGGNGRTVLLGIVGGAVLGGVAGHHIEEAVNTQKAYEYIVKLNSGETIAITQGLDTDLRVGEKILLLYGARSRLIPDTLPANSSKHMASKQ